MSKWRFFSYRRKRWRDITKLLARDGSDCAICGLALDHKLRDFTHPLYITFDHITPRSKGGLSDLANLRLAHQQCNHERGNDPLVEEEGQAA